MTFPTANKSSYLSRLLLSLGLFLLALLPRLPDLGRFLTADEFLWVDRSRNFLAGLTDPAYQCTTAVEPWTSAQGLACTLRTGHPGVTTMWTGSFGFWLRWLLDGRPGSLHDYVVAVVTNPLDPTFIAPERLGTVLVTSLWVVAVYWLARRLWGWPVALLGAVLIALDPFHIALSRVIHHDALSTTFMTLSILSAFIYWGEQNYRRPATLQGKSAPGGLRPVASYFQRRRWLVLSGLLAGLGFISKSPALFLMPVIALIGLWFFGLEGWRAGGLEGWRTGRLEDWKTDWSLLETSLPWLIGDGLLWFATACLAAFIAWPALWVVPRETIGLVLAMSSAYAEGGHAKGNFFLGQVSQDPGVLFYPVTWLYRTSPLVMLGVVLALLAWGKRVSALAKGERRKAQSEERGFESANQEPPSSLLPPPALQPSSPPAFPSSFFRYLPLILLFILGYCLFMSMGEKKQERYFLPVYPWFNLIAAAGLAQLAASNFWQLAINKLKTLIGASSAPFPPKSVSNLQPPTSNLQPPTSNFTIHNSQFTILLLILLLTNGFLVAANFPYYFTYYNPLLGGITGAEKEVTLGWGEGLDQAAAYLNEHVDPSRTRVASWYQSTFAPFYRGESISYSKEKGKALAGDYVIFYINQTQRRYPDEAMFTYFESRFAPVQVINLHGVDYAWIYPSLGVDHYVADQTYTGIASLLAWEWQGGDAPLAPGRPARFDLYWEYLGKRPDEPFFVRLVDAQGRPWAEGLSQPAAADNPPPDRWQEGEIVKEQGSLVPPPDLPPGQYRLQIGFYTKAPAVTAGELLFTLEDKDARLLVGPAGPGQPYTLPGTAVPLGQPLGPALTLLGAGLPGENLARPGAETPVTFPVDLYWRVEQPLSADTRLHAALLDSAGVARQAWFNISLAETFNPEETTWQPGDILHTRWQLDLATDILAGRYRLDLVLPDTPAGDPSNSLAAGMVTVE